MDREVGGPVMTRREESIEAKNEVSERGKEREGYVRRWTHEWIGRRVVEIRYGACMVIKKRGEAPECIED